MNEKEVVSALVKGLNVIKAFDKEHTHMTLSDVAKKVNITRASARRLLLTLESLGYVSQRDNFFYLSPKIIELGFSYYASLPWTDIAHKNLKQVANECKLSCSISILDDTNIICIMRIAAQRVLSEGIHVGTRLPTAYTATGRVYLAHMEDKQLRKFINSLPLKAHTQKSITCKNELYEKIIKTKHQPYQIVQEELEDGLIAIAAPIYDKENKIIGAMNIGSHLSYKSTKIVQDEILPKLIQASKQTSEVISLLQY